MADMQETRPQFKGYTLKGLVSAVFTPLTDEGLINLDVIDKYVEHLAANDVKSVFVNGSTGESVSLTVHERKLLAKKWVECGKGRLDNVVIHIGCSSLLDCKELAKHAQEIGASAISAMPPVFFKPKSEGALLQVMKEIASAAPETPFYYYHIPGLTNVNLSMVEFCRQASESDFPSFCGLKYSSPDLATAVECLRRGYQILYGCDQQLLGAYALGIDGAVGSTYNFMPQIYHRMIKAFNKGDIAAARQESYKTQAVINLMCFDPDSTVFLPKYIMSNFGIELGPSRLPIRTPSKEEVASQQQKLQDLGFFDWVKKN